MRFVAELSQRADVAAYRLSQKGDILSFLDSLRTAADVAAVLSREARMEMLSRMAELNDKQRLFCRLVAVERLNQGEAYAQAFGCKSNSAGTLAGRLMKKAEVREEIQRLSTEVKECRVRAVVAAHCWSKVERQERLQRWADELMEAGKAAEAIRCIDILNKMNGAYAQPDGVQVNVQQGLSIGDVVASVMGVNVVS